MKQITIPLPSHERKTMFGTRIVYRNVKVWVYKKCGFWVLAIIQSKLPGDQLADAMTYVQENQTAISDQIIRKEKAPI
jgi:hypothetical protein